MTAQEFSGEGCREAVQWKVCLTADQAQLQQSVPRVVDLQCCLSGSHT